MLHISDVDIDVLSNLFREYFNDIPKSVVKLPGSGSNRKYYRLNGCEEENPEILESLNGCSVGCIGTVGDDERECRAFINLGNVFRSQGINVPEIYLRTPDYLNYIQEDLGKLSLMDIILKGDRTNLDASVEIPGVALSVRELVSATLKKLAEMQQVEWHLWNDSAEYNPFCLRQALWDLNYFKYEYLKPSAVVFDEEKLQDDFEAFADSLCENNGFNGFMFRDFQSRNVMIRNNEPWFIDFQGGRKGPAIYDAVSFLWQAKAKFPDDFRYGMIEEYLSHFPTGYFPQNRDARISLVNRFVLFRTLQVLGAYGFRGLVEKKSHFIESIPQALENLSAVIKMGIADEYKELKRVCEKICDDFRFKNITNRELVVSVFSFSYKKGYPDDFTGNGGGFMFDCRGMHNPGRYEEYKSLTGLDRKVIDFLETKGEVTAFVSKAKELILPSVQTYLRRGFSNLQVGFGCTGGQHRSVYCAEKLANELKREFPDVAVKIIHREQKISRQI